MSQIDISFKTNTFEEDDDLIGSSAALLRSIADRVEELGCDDMVDPMPLFDDEGNLIGQFMFSESSK